MSDPKILTVQRMYEAFGRGDVEAVLADVTDDVQWGSAPDSTAAPWYGDYHGKAEVARFFKEIGTNVQVTELTPLAFTSNDTDVMVALRWGFTVHATGKSVSADMYHWFRFVGGLVAVARTLEDTAQAAAAFS